jgi:catechol 2,3-dioxygenase-like lactoylglutathione lyase family enzyme
MAGILPAGTAQLHHVGIVCPDRKLLGPLLSLAGSRTNGAGGEVASAYVPEFQCDCYLLGQLELVVPTDPDEDGAPLTPLQRWLKGRGTSLHHIAFELDDVDGHCAALRERGVPVVLEQAVAGVADLRVNFVHPSYCGFLVELVEPQPVAARA